MQYLKLGRFQFSVRSLLLVTRSWHFPWPRWSGSTRERQRMLRAREEAIRSVLLAERRRVEFAARRAPGGATAEEVETQGDTTEIPSVAPEILIEHLRRENDELKDTVDSLRDEVKRLRAANRR